MSRITTLFTPLGLSLLIAVPALAQDASSQTRSVTESSPSQLPPPADIRECAEIAQGVRRLRCYDHFLQPDDGQTPDVGVDPDLVDTLESFGIDADEFKESQQRRRDPTLVEQTLERQRTLFSYSGAFVRHRANYLLPVSYVDTVNNAPLSPNFGREQLQEDFSNVEAKFQFSLRLPVLTGIFNDRTTLWAAYTQVSFWQAYNSPESSPFRESNYEPEIFLSYQPGLNIGPGSFDFLSIGFNHQSNGRSDPLSRSWNRILANVVYSNDRWVFSVSPWYRIPESSNEDNNPDIHKYLGYADYNFSYKLADDATVGLLFRNNMDLDENRSTFRLDYTFPISDSLSAYVQYYHGWGESLIDYNRNVQRIGIGIKIRDF